MCAKHRLAAVVAALLLAPWSAGVAQPQCLIGTYADPMHCDVNVFTSGNFQAVDFWVWVKPAAAGLKAIEFSVDYPAGTFFAQTYVNPAIVVWLGDLANGVSAAFGACQTDWVWTHRQMVFVASPTIRGYFAIDDNPSAAPYFKQYASCEEGHPIYPLTVYNYMAVNQCAYLCGCSPRIQTVQPLTPSKLRVDFGTCVGTYGDPHTDNFHLFADGSTVETIHVVASQRISDGVFDLTLDAALTHGTTYVLVAKEIPDCEQACPWFECSSRKFLFDEAIATLLRTHGISIVDGAVELAWELSDVDPGAAFAVSRSADGGAFEALGGEPNEVARLNYRYVDEGVEPGRRYVYRVEYSAGGERMELFTSDEIALPAARLALHQNVPNPFNPSTTISFTLPEPRTVTLEIYDVSGRLVARLLDGGTLPAGAHYVDWNGRDDGGKRCASGIYFCRLAAGKDRLTRKMALLR